MTNRLEETEAEIRKLRAEVAELHHMVQQRPDDCLVFDEAILRMYVFLKDELGYGDNDLDRMIRNKAVGNAMRHKPEP